MIFPNKESSIEETIKFWKKKAHQMVSNQCFLQNVTAYHVGGLFNRCNVFDERFFVYFEEVDLNKLKQKDYFTQLRSRILYSRKHFNFFSYLSVYFLSLIVEPFSRIVFSLARFEFKEILETISAYKLLFSWSLKKEKP